jgi:hypothetical protein
MTTEKENLIKVREWASGGGGGALYNLVNYPITVPTHLMSKIVVHLPHSTGGEIITGGSCSVELISQEKSGN